MEISILYNHSGKEIRVTAFLVPGKVGNFNTPDVPDEIIDIDCDSMADFAIIDSNKDEVNRLLWLETNRLKKEHYA